MTTCAREYGHDPKSCADLHSPELNLAEIQEFDTLIAKKL